jgi:NitT/TauT family transport system ATP-binding protein
MMEAAPDSTRPGLPRLSVRDAAKRYGDLLALSGCSFNVGRDAIVALVGPSGCGKTTLLWSMSGLHPLTSGEVLLEGQPVKGPRAEIGLVFQEANLLPWRTLLQNILFPFEIKRQAPDRAWVNHLLDRVGLLGFEGRMPRELSGGMQQRGAIVRALALRPSVLLMDEPFGALDAFTREEMNRLLEEIWLEAPTTIVFVTHSIEEAVLLADRVVVLTRRPGRVLVDRPVPFPRPRGPEIMASREAFDLMNEIKADIYAQQVPRAPARAAAE